METLQSNTDLHFLKAQITADDKELREILKGQRVASEGEAPPVVKRRASTPKKSSGNEVRYTSEPILVQEPAFQGSWDRSKHQGFQSGKVWEKRKEVPSWRM